MAIDDRVGLALLCAGLVVAFSYIYNKYLKEKDTNNLLRSQIKFNESEMTKIADYHSKLIMSATNFKKLPPIKVVPMTMDVEHFEEFVTDESEKE